MDDRHTQHYKFAEKFGEDAFELVEDFHEYSKLSKTLDADLNRRIHLFLHAPPVRHLAVQAWREYLGYPRVPLPEQTLGTMSLQEALFQRRSLPNRQGTPGAALTFERLSAILRWSYGETGSIDTGPGTPKQPLRATCSAGGLYPLEIYPVVFEVPGIDAGIYHYNVRHNCLERLKEGSTKEEFLTRMPHQEMCRTAGAILVITAVLERSLSKYMNRGYRFVMNDCGALLQSLYLTCTALGVDASAWGGFPDDELAQFVGVDGHDEIVAMSFVVGRV